MNTKGQKTKKSHQTRIKIMDVFIQLMKTKDFATITVKAIADKANITRGTFYLYFSDIYEMITYIEDALLSDMPSTPILNQSRIDKIRYPTFEECHNNDWEREWFHYYERYHEQFNALLGPHGDAMFYGKIKKTLQSAILIRMEQDGMPNDLLRDYFVTIIPDIFLLLAKEWTSREHPDSIDIHSITTIASTIRIGARYLAVVDSRHKMNLDESTDKE